MGKVLSSLLFGGLAAFQEVQTPSSGSWTIFMKKNAGSLRGIWKPAQEVTQSLLYRLQFVTQIIILTSCNLILL